MVSVENDTEMEQMLVTCILSPTFSPLSTLFPQQPLLRIVKAQYCLDDSINPFQNDKILDWTKSKTSVDETINKTEN